MHCGVAHARLLACAPLTYTCQGAEVAVPPDTPKAELEAVLAKLDAHKAEWAALPVPEKATMFRACMQTTIEVRFPDRARC